MSTAVATSLLEKLKEIQTREGLSDYKFSDKLGISHQLWQMTRTGKREIGLAVLQGTLRAYPELARDVLFFLQGDVASPLISDTITTTPSENAQNRFLGGLCHGLMIIIKRLFVR